MAGRSRITPHNTHPVHSVTPMASKTMGTTHVKALCQREEMAYRICPPSSCPAGIRLSEVTNRPTQLAIRIGWGSNLSIDGTASIRPSSVTVNGQWNWTNAGGVGVRARRPGEQNAQDGGGDRHQVARNRAGNAHLGSAPGGKSDTETGCESQHRRFPLKVGAGKT